MKINIVRPFLPDFNEIEKEFKECLSTGLVTNNPYYTPKFEHALKSFFNTDSTPVCYCNGEMGLFSLIHAWKTKMGYSAHDNFDVLVPSFTFSGTLNAIVMNNLNPIFCDIDETLTIDVNKIASVGSNTKMIVAVGVYGNLPDLDQVKKFANDHNLVLLFDNAPAFGSTFKGYYPANYNLEEVYSFHATKIFTSMEGGAAISHDETIQSFLARLRNFGQYEKTIGDVDIPGLNSKMQEISAITGLKNLDHIEEILEKRSQNVDRYKAFFEDLEEKGYLQTMKVRDEVFCPYLYFPVILNEEASDFIQFMEEHGIAVRRYYTSVHTLKYYKNKYHELDLSFTNAITGKIVALPIHTIMDQSEMDHLFSVVADYFKKN